MIRKLIISLILSLLCFWVEAQTEKPDILIGQTEMTPAGGQPFNQTYWFNTNLASLTKTGVIFPSTGSYRFDLSAYAVAGSPSISLLIDGVIQSGTGTLTWTGAPIAIKSLFITSITAGSHTVAIRISNFSGSSHIRVGLLYFTRTSLQVPYVYPVLTPHNLPAFSTPLTLVDFGSKKLRGFSLGSNGTNQPAETRASMIAMKATGANIARCFVEIERLSGNTYTFKAGELIKLDTTLARAASLGFYVVPVMFHDPSLNNDYWGTSANSIARRLSIAILWKTIAARTVGKAYVAALDLINEPRSNFNYAEVIRWETQMLDTIRAIDPTHVVAVECISNDMFAMMLPLGYSNVIYSPHGYSTLLITHQGVAGEPTANIRNNYPHIVSTGNLAAPWGITQLSAQHNDVRIMSQRFNVPVFVGEFSCVNWSPASSTAGKWTSTEWCNDNITLLEAEGWSWVYHNWNRGGEAIEWDPEIPSSFYNAIAFTNARPNTIATPAAESPVAPTIVMLEGWFGLNVATTCPTSGTTTANKYHFSTLCGDDSRTPLQARNPTTPWKTLAKASSYFPSLLAGDTLAFNSGETFSHAGATAITISKSGTLSSPIVITSYGTGAKPIFSGFTDMSTFVNASGVWTSAANSSLLGATNIVTSNGALQPLGRFPNPGAANGGYLTYSSHVNDTVIIASAALATNWAGATAHVRTERWIMDGSLVLRQTGTRIRFANNLNTTPVDGSGFFFNKDIRTLDQTGEWYYNPTNKTVSVFSGSTPTGIKASAVNDLISSTNFSFITINGIAFEGVNNADINLTNGSGWKILNCDFNFSGNRAVNVQTHTSLTMTGCTVNNSMTDGVFINSVSASTFSDNSIANTAQVVGMNSLYGQFGCGINHHGFNVIFLRNNITRSGYSGLLTFPTVTTAGNITIQNNYIDTFCNGTNDGGGIYLWNGRSLAMTGNNILSNIVLHGIGAVAGTTNTTTAAEGIYLDIDVTGTNIIGNSIGYAQRGIFLHFTRSILVRNNTTFDNTWGFYVQSRTASGDVVRLCQNKANKFVARTAPQYTGYFLTDSSNIPGDIKQFFISGGCDSNYYARPITQTSNPTHIRNSTTNVSLPAWVTAYASVNYDVHSNVAPRAITADNQMAFHYNNTASSVPLTLTGNWVDMANVPYSGTISLPSYSSLVLIQTAALITPTVTWNNPAAITYPAPLTATQLNATASVPGTFDYSPTPLGTVLNAGTQTLSVLFTPTDGATYSQVTKTVTIVVNKASATITYSNLTQTYTGLPLAPTITTNPAGLTVLSTTYNGVGMTPINAGTYAIITGLTNQNYQAPTINGTFTINKATAIMTASNLNQIYDGGTHPITVVTNPVGLSGVAITYNGSGAPTNAGSYAVVVTLTNTNYTATQINTTLVIAKALPTVSWSNPTAITYGTALSGTQLNATASVAGTFTYTPAAGAILNAGTQLLSVDFTPTDNVNYQTVNNTTVTITVNKAVATLSLSNTTQVYDGSSKSVTVTSSPAGLAVITVTYDGSAVLPINAGTYAVVASLSNSNYTAVNATGNLVITKADATIFISGLTKTYTGSAQAVTTTTVPVGLTVISVTYDGSPTAPTNTGSYAVVASLVNVNYQATNANATLVINKATPVITWATPAAITYPTPLSGTQLNATANVAGSFVYVPPSGTVLNAGSQTLSTTFTPTDASNYNTVSNVVVSILVQKATATLTLSGLAQDYDGNPKPVTVTSNPAGLGTIAVTYVGSPTPPTAEGSYQVIATLTNANYQASPVIGTLVISPNVAAVQITNLIQTYTGSPLPVTVTVAGGWSTEVRYNGSLTVPTNVATYTVIATINDGIHTGADTATYNIIKATPSITWANPANITFGTALSGTQLNASSATAGSFSYVPPSGTILPAGTHIISVNFTPTDGANYNTTSKAVTIVVDKAVATITLGSLTQAYDGTPKSATATTSPIGLSVVTFTYNGSNTPPTAVGNYGVIATLTNSNYSATPATDTLRITSSTASITVSNLLQTYTGSPLPVTVNTNPDGLTYSVTYNASSIVPTNAGTYTVIATITGGTYTGADTATYVIGKATPIIIWNNPASITYGTALSGTQLNATSNIAGTFVYSPASGIVPNAGTQNLSTTFTPTDAANYNTVVKIVTIVVTGTSATLTLSGLTATYNGVAKSVTVTTTPAGLSGVSVTYNGSATPPTNAGSYNVVASLMNNNYTASNVSGTLVIAKANPSLTWVNPTPIKVGTALSSIQLNATSNIAGTFVYTPSFGAVLSTGTQRLSATFTPTDIVNYNSVTITVPISVFGNPVQDFYLRHGKVKYIEIP